VRSAEPYVGADAASTTLGRVLGLRQFSERPTVLDEGSERRDGVLIRRLRWSVGYGPDTSAWLLRPAGVRRVLPGILGMHCHGGVRSVGAEQLVDLGPNSSPRAAWLRASYYADRAPANELARYQKNIWRNGGSLDRLAGHAFDAAMQDEARAFLAEAL
jgi:hypothetical protein